MSYFQVRVKILKDSSGGEMGRTQGHPGSSWPPQGWPRKTCPLLGVAWHVTQRHIQSHRSTLANGEGMADEPEVLLLVFHCLCMASGTCGGLHVWYRAGRGAEALKELPRKGTESQTSVMIAHISRSPGVRCTSVLTSLIRTRNAEDAWQKMSLSTLTAQEGIKALLPDKARCHLRRSRAREKLKTKHLSERECRAREMIKESETYFATSESFPSSPLPHRIERPKREASQGNYINCRKDKVPSHFHIPVNPIYIYAIIGFPQNVSVF